MNDLALIAIITIIILIAMQYATFRLLLWIWHVEDEQESLNTTTHKHTQHNTTPHHNKKRR